MKIAAPYSANDKYSDLPDEYNLPWGENSTERKLLDFCEIISDKRINIFTEKDVNFDLDAIVTAKKINPNIYVRLNIYQIPLINQLKEKEIKFYFDTTYPCGSCVILDAMVNIEVSDIYIYDDLFYNLERVKPYLEQKNIQVRMILNRVASTSPQKNIDIYGPYVTPRDMDILEQYIDVAEFDCGDTFYNWNKFNAYYKTFIIRKEWFGELRELNEDIEFSLPIYSTVPNFVERKMRCRRICSIDGGCNHCDIIVNTARDFYQQEIALKPVKIIENEVKKE